MDQSGVSSAEESSDSSSESEEESESSSEEDNSREAHKNNVPSFDDEPIELKVINSYSS